MTGAFLDALAAAEDASDRLSLLQAVSARESVAAGIQNAVVGWLYSDRSRAIRYVEAGRQFADLTGNPMDDAYATRGEAHLAYVNSRHGEAAALYEAAAAKFVKLNADSEEARTRSSGLQCLIYLGRYDQAREWADRAEFVFLQQNDLLRLARLDSNVGNIYFRQDRPRDAIERYERALEAFSEFGDAKDVAAALNNLVVSHTSLGQFAEAHRYYLRVREHCDARNLAPLSAQADYNIAYLHFLRGDYAEARRHYQASREICARTGDSYHAALCDLDESELALELNLTAEGESMARRAVSGFEELGMRYEQAKALVNLAVAASQRTDLRATDKILRQARSLSASEGNQVWPALIDLFRAVLSFHDARYATAQRLGESAWEVLSGSMIPSRAAHCQILLARLWLRAGHTDRSRAAGREAVARLGDYPSPSLLFHANLLEGEINEKQGLWKQAFASYEAARAELEDLRGRLDTEDLRISLLKDKLAVYESLVSMCLDSPLAARMESSGHALLMVQQAKSRSLADRLLQPGLVSAEGGTEIEEKRSELNWVYRQVEASDFRQRAGIAGSRVGELRARARSLEAELLDLQSRNHRAAGAPLLAPAETVDSLLSAIPPQAAILEYLEYRGVLALFVLRRSGFSVVKLGPLAPVRHSLKLLQFQLGRCRLAPRNHRGRLGLNESSYHLGELYQQLVEPAEKFLEGCTHLVIAPHRHLHALPFAALGADGAALMDRFTVSVAPSASVYAACRRRTVDPPGSDALVIGIPDAKNPHIEAETRYVAAQIPGAGILMGNEATRQAFLENARGLKLLHLATHGVFRRDNPMFSSIEMADGRLTLIDLASARLNIGLLVLSSCSSGASVPVGGDELMGLMRGFLAAGAQRLVVSLWEVDDQATAEFMRVFYGEFVSGSPAERSMQTAMRRIRQEYRHPFYWAPFVLVGNCP